MKNKPRRNRPEIKHGRIHLHCVGCGNLKSTDLNQLQVRRTKKDDVIHEWTCTVCWKEQIWMIAGRPFEKTNPTDNNEAVEKELEALKAEGYTDLKVTRTKRDATTGAVTSKKRVKKDD